MSIQVFCENCHKELDEPGAILISPPNKASVEVVFKIHLCKECFKVIDEIIKRGV